MSQAQNIHIEEKLVSDITLLIEESRSVVANTLNTTLVLLYWKIGNRINADVLQHKRAEYGKQIIASLTQQLTERYGKGWDEKTLRHCLRAAETFSEDIILSALRRELRNLSGDSLDQHRLRQSRLSGGPTRIGRTSKPSMPAPSIQKHPALAQLIL